MKPITLSQYITAGYSGVFIASHEETRVEMEVAFAAKETGYKVMAWSIASGVTDPESGTVIPETEDPVAAIGTFAALPPKTILLARDFHPFMGDAHSPANPVLVRKLKDALMAARAQRKTWIMSGHVAKLAPELEKLVVVIDLPLPDRETLGEVLDAITKDAKVKVPTDSRDKILDAASGLTTTEAEDAFALSIATTDTVDPELVNAQKCNVVKKSGILEVVDSKTTLDDIGGLENAKARLMRMRGLFTKEAREFGLPTPRGWLTVGQPGTGKSLTATACKSIFGVPLLRLEAGRLFGSLVGESERNWRTAFATAKAVSPCILWIDEVDGLFSGMGGASTDGGTTQRVLKTILQDMQMNSAGVFFFLTANDVDRLPDPLIDRLDVWSVDLPRRDERKQIAAIHIAKPREQHAGRNPEKFNLDQMADATEGFSGRQIEQVWCEAVELAFSEGREVKTGDFVQIANQTVPTSVLMKDAIEARRQRLANRAKPASNTADSHAATSFATVSRKIGRAGK